ncbi:MAG: pyrimidine-nucleoside phosphorylase [Oscillospiraceae bacterium]|nr:pyrimidine-nucleoside phosphorylase [Oscillospiraceae bacterium]
MRMYDIIEKKRNGEELNSEEINFFIKGYTEGSIPDYQASAFCMAVYFMGMTENETVILTEAMANSGDTVDLSMFGNKSADKHSTGGVGDKTSLIVAPIVAALGGKVTKMSGRGLGHTGGTVDKLESIPGYKTTLFQEEFISQIEKVGMAIIGQSGNLTPADKKLYALRDVTATVDSIPLIVSSIMSKKIAAGSHNIVLDVKCGSGAFMKTLEDAEILAREMVKIGKGCGRNMAALITDMDRPLGSAIGNSLEVIEAVKVLKGELVNDLKEVCVSIASEMISLVYSISHDEALKMVNDTLNSGKAFMKMKEWISAQGGDTNFIDNTDLFRKAEFSFDILAETSGYITSMDTEKIGLTSVILGAGRASKEDSIDFSAGILIYKKTGDEIRKGEKIATLFTNNNASLDDAVKMYNSSIAVSSVKPEQKPLIYKIIR